MKNCTEINELLSAYADNELTESDKISVEEHLAACESCSALLEIYREISISAEESNVPVPDALRIGVMNRIRSEIIETEADKEPKKKKWWQHQVLLTRLAPVAACLAVVLLVWQFGGNMSEGGGLFGRNDSAAPQAMSVPDVQYDAAEAPMAAPEPRQDFAWDSEGDEGELLPEAAGSVENFPLEVASDDLSLSDGLFDEEFKDVGDDTAKRRRISSFFNNAYAEITIIGELPVLLADYEPLPLIDWEGWESVYEIPSTEVEALLAELNDRPGVSIVRTHNNQNSLYAIIFFSRR